MSVTVNGQQQCSETCYEIQSALTPGVGAVGERESKLSGSTRALLFRKSAATMYECTAQVTYHTLERT